jgi:hypothetical protein
VGILVGMRALPASALAALLVAGCAGDPDPVTAKVGAACGLGPRVLHYDYTWFTSITSYWVYVGNRGERVKVITPDGPIDERLPERYRDQLTVSCSEGDPQLLLTGITPADMPH